MLVLELLLWPNLFSPFISFSRFCRSWKGLLYRNPFKIRSGDLMTREQTESLTKWSILLKLSMTYIYFFVIGDLLKTLKASHVHVTCIALYCPRSYLLQRIATRKGYRISRCVLYKIILLFFREAHFECMYVLPKSDIIDSNKCFLLFVLKIYCDTPSWFLHITYMIRVGDILNLHFILNKTITYVLFNESD